MKYFLLIATILFKSVSAKTQSMEETISYINTLFKTSTLDLNDYGFNTPYEKAYDSISVDKNGKLECFRFLIDRKTKGIESKMRFFVYLKAISTGEKKDYSFYYLVKLKCITNDYCFGGISAERNDISFDINTSSNRDKIFNAFEHLLRLAKSNKDFYEKDPFGN